MATVDPNQSPFFRLRVKMLVAALSVYSTIILLFFYLSLNRLVSSMTLVYVEVFGFLCLIVVGSGVYRHYKEKIVANKS